MDKKILITVTVILVFSFLHPVHINKKEIKTFEDFEKGTFNGTGLTDAGELFLSLKSTSIKGPVREYFLSASTSKQGDIYVGTGHNASVFKIGKDNKISEIFKASEPDIYAILHASNGIIYAGSSPRGKLYHITGKDKSKIFFNPDEKYIWDLKEDKSGDIICAVGGSGGVYRIDRKGNSRKIFTSGDIHIMTLFISSDNSILAGSGGKGILYRISGNKSTVIYDTPFEEINGICEDNEGNIWFAASKEVKRDKITTISGGDIRFSFPKESPLSKEKSALFLKTPGGEVEKIWSSSTEQIYSVTFDKKNSGILIGTGDKGRIYRVKKDRSFSLIFESDSAQTYRIIPEDNGFIAIFNNTSSIVKLQNFSVSKGSYISETFNLGLRSRVGKLYWESETTDTTSVSVFVRSGNTSSPDSTWTEWSPPYKDNNNSKINRGGIKYLQVKINLNSTGQRASPYLSGYHFYFVQDNMKPVLKSIVIKPPKPIIKKIPNLKKSGSRNNKVLSIQWEATDPNKDDLKHTILIRKISGQRWLTLKKDFSGKKTALNMEFYEDGKYIAKIVTDDSLSNSPDLYKSATRLSKVFTIDSTAPVLSGFNKTGDIFTFDVVDKHSVISDVRYSFTGEKWFPLDPVDLINDSLKESFKLPGKILKNKKTILFKLTDEYKNSKVFQREL